MRSDHAQAARARRMQGWRDGYAGKPKRSKDPDYLRGYSAGSSAWSRDQAAELAEWKAAHS